jgi:hypothetical protein
MKRRLQFILLLASVITALAIFSCKKDKAEEYTNNAEITMIDNSVRPCRLDDPCNCPGGFFIHIDNVPDPHGSCILCTSFKALKLPAGFELGDNPLFPIPVKISWKYDALSCDSSRIDITSIARR